MTTSLVSRDKIGSEEEGHAGRGRVGRHRAAGRAVHDPFLGVPAAGGAAYMTYKWFMYRAKRGMRF